MPELTNAPARLRLITAAILGLVLAAASLLPALAPAAAAAEPLPDDLQAALWTALRAARENSIAPGMSMSVLTADGRQWSGADGWETNGDVLSVDDSMLIGSVTKTFTAAIILQLAEEGRLNINERTSAYLHNVRLVKHTTVRQLLGHTSGIADLYQPALGILQGAPDTSLCSTLNSTALSFRHVAQPERGAAADRRELLPAGAWIPLLEHELLPAGPRHRARHRSHGGAGDPGSLPRADGPGAHANAGD